MENKECFLLSDDKNFFSSESKKMGKYVPELADLNKNSGEELYADTLHHSMTTGEIETWNSRIGPVILLTRIPISKQFRNIKGIHDYELINIDHLETKLGETHSITENPVKKIPSLIPPVPEKGTFESRTWPILLSLIHLNRASGTLFLKSEKVKKSVTFYNGLPVEIKSNKVKELLGRMLVDEGVVTAEQCESSLHMMRTEKIMQGEAFVKMGLMKEEDIALALNRQYAIKFVDIFLWNNSEFVFRSEKTQPIKTQHNYIELVFSGLNLVPRGTYDPPLNLASGLYPVSCPDPFLRFQTLPREIDFSIFNQCDGRVQLKDFSEKLVDPQAKNLFLALMYSGVIILCGNPLEIPVSFCGFPLPGESSNDADMLISELENEWHSGEIDQDRIEYWLRKIHPDRFTGFEDSIRHLADEWFTKLVERRPYPHVSMRHMEFFNSDWKG
ncbi:DUF4388 domain-containing protein [Myxococcota bacterium]|nr:DUF4388 domain-containing protein [Myxococcota bacterium]MBU1380880.1 DUF4388 domain-containing protein [Myxococcota bacterium]MBU1497008.1 DUF4388 domain-containing protein [Myxococcota bacterium]